MKNQLKKAVLFAVLLFSPVFCFGQYLELGILSSFEGYTGNGAATNSGIFTGDIGTYAGALTGFIPPKFTGNIYNDDSVTVQARKDLLKIYIHLSNAFVTYPGTHAPAFGGGETITPGVYSSVGAGSVGGDLTLDGGGSTNAVFILKFAGAFTVGAGTRISLSNGTRACNVFWIAQGAISIAANSTLKGGLFSYPGAISLGENCDVEGRIFTSSGAVTIGLGSVVIAPVGPSTIPIDCSNDCAAAPAVNVLASVANFALFTSAGALANTASSGIIGDIGTNDGAISGFGSSEHIGAVHPSGAITAQAVMDLDIAYGRLMLLPNTVLSHAPAFGTGETLNAGVYYINGAGSLAGTIILDGQNNYNAIFVFKFAGAFAVAAQSKVIFTNGTRRCNVFWIGGAGVATGAVSIGASSHIKGTFISHGGACTSGAGTNVEGRMLSTAGAIGFSTGVIYNNPLCIKARPPLPVDLLRFTAVAKDGYIQLSWVTATEINNDYFTAERSADAVNFASITKTAGAGNSTQILSYSAVDRSPLPGMAYYRLKQTDYNKKPSYSTVKSVRYKGLKRLSFDIYPNPTNGQSFNLQLLESDGEELLVVIHDLLGREIYSKVTVTDKNNKGIAIASQKITPGVYWITATSGSGTHKKKLIVMSH